MPDIISVQGLVKRFGDTTAVDGVTFGIRQGEIFGLLGPNGAGKTTAISMISCLLAPTQGDVTVDGASVRTDPSSVKRALGVVPQDIALYPTLTAIENLHFWGRMYGLSGKLLEERTTEALQLAGLADRARERIENYSGGMKRRINIAAGVMHHPRVLLMDEPTVGIDPQSRNHILETVKELNRRGMTVLYTSHYMEEVEFLCDRVAIVDHGRVIALGTIDELKRLVGDENVVTVSVESLPPGAVEALRALPGVDGVLMGGASDEGEEGEEPTAGKAAAAQFPGKAAATKPPSKAADAQPPVEGAPATTDAGPTIRVLSKDASGILARVVTALTDAGARITAIDVREPDLESVFLHLTGKSLRD